MTIGSKPSAHKQICTFLSGLLYDIKVWEMCLQVVTFPNLLSRDQRHFGRVSMKPWLLAGAEVHNVYIVRTHIQPLLGAAHACAEGRFVVPRDL